MKILANQAVNTTPLRYVRTRCGSPVTSTLWKQRVQCHNIVYSYSNTSFTLLSHGSLQFFPEKGGSRGLEGNDENCAETGVHKRVEIRGIQY